MDFRNVISDNEPQIVLEDFEDFCDENNITHIKVTTYHLKFKDLAKRAVRTYREQKSASGKSVNWKTRLNHFLFS